VAGQTSVFAVGDVAAADHKHAGIASRQAQLVAGNIRALMAGDGELASWEPAPTAIVVPIGPEGGSGQLPDSDELAPPELVAQLKGREMMVSRFAEILGVTVPVGA
jgi:NADH dehydrogenase FAD-containing subunit